MHLQYIKQYNKFRIMYFRFTSCPSLQEIRLEFLSIEKHYQEAISEKDQQLQLLKNRMAASRVAPSEDRGVSSWREIDVVQWLNCNLVVRD